MTRRTWLVLLVLTLVPVQASAQTKIDSAAVDAIVKDTREQWKAPGLAVAIVLGDEVHLHGVGVRELGKDDPVTPDTVFAYASITKAFAATALGLLVDDGKADWDDHVRKHLDWFRLHDPLADREVRLRDLLCHRVGLSRHDVLLIHAPWSLEETVRRMAHLEPSSSFRSRYEYNNLAYVAAGMAIGNAAGMPWNEFLQRRILTPLGMKNAVFTGADARARKDHATPHRRDKSGNQAAIAWYPDEKQVRASGSLKGGVRDLSAWMRMQLGSGVFEGKRIISTASLQETHTPQIVVPLNRTTARMTETTQISYGLGWQIHDYRGWRIDEHTGSNEGFRGRLILVPKARLGIALLTNCEENTMLSACGNRLLDQLLGLNEKEWTAFYKKVPKTDARPATPARKKDTKPSRDLPAYTGKYRDAAYGDLVIKEEGKDLVLMWSSFRATLGHFHHDTFQTRDTSIRLQDELATFTLDARANVASVRFLGRTFRRVG